MKRIKFLFLPPGSTSVLQPLDCGIIKIFKNNYKKKLINDYFNQIEKNRFIKKIDIQKALIFADLSWKEVKTQTIINCWKKSSLK